MTIVAFLTANSMVAGIYAQSTVIGLTNKTFASTTNTEQPLLVEFYAPWCGHCQSLTPEFEAAGKTLKEYAINVARVGYTIHSVLYRTQGITSYPTLKIYQNEQSKVYSGARTTDAIVNYMGHLV